MKQQLLEKWMRYKKRLPKVFLLLLFIIVSHLYLQAAQNGWELSVALKFAFLWHSEKFILGTIVLLLLFVFLFSLLGRMKETMLVFGGFVGLLGIADTMKMSARKEPIYPSDFFILTEPKMLMDILGGGLFLVLVLLLIGMIVISVHSILKSRIQEKGFIVKRVILFILCSICLCYTTSFNSEKNLLRKAYNQTALWIPYSQEMNYYNVGFVGGFLYNLQVEAMQKPKDYSKEKVAEIVKKYAPKDTEKEKKTPNIVFVMSESFSDPENLSGISLNQDPLQSYWETAKKGVYGKMLSAGFGGGTANIEFEALTSLSMELLSLQMTTPYTQLLPSFQHFPSLVSTLEKRGYQTTAIHPYNTSMYKRREVYDVLGFDDFLNEDTMKHREKIEKNPYISDSAAYQEVLDLLRKKNNRPQFIHLVTMQTHNPYTDKYQSMQYKNTEGVDNPGMQGYFQDIAYASEAFKAFVSELQKNDRETLVVFWGDHVPGVYPKEITQRNTNEKLHETLFSMMDVFHEKEKEVPLTSTMYFSPMLFEEYGLGVNGFQNLALHLQKVLPAFEKGMVEEDGAWLEKLALDDKGEEIYNDYQMIEYDLLQGKQYSIAMNFFD